MQWYSVRLVWGSSLSLAFVLSWEHMPDDDEKARKSECASQLGRELPMRMEAAKRLPAINRQSWQCEKKAINPTPLRKKSEFAVIDFDEVITSTMWLPKTNTSLTLFMWKILRCKSGLALYIANIASLNRWLAPIGNDCIRWSVNLKKIASEWSKPWKTMKTNQKSRKPKHQKAPSMIIITSVAMVTCVQKTLVSRRFKKRPSPQKITIVQVYLHQTEKM